MASASAQTSRGVRLSQVYPDSDEVETDIDIIAVHGLDTKSPDTWTWKSPRCTQTELSANDDHKSRDVNWLKDLHMLPSVVGRARIFTCDWPAELFQPGDLVQSTIDEIALGLLDGIHRRSPPKNKARDERPIIFIASCLGGIILTKALVDADSQRSDYRHVRKATRGAIFLATPFEGTSFEKVALWAEPGLRSWALLRGQQLNPLLKLARSPDFDLNKLMRQFTQLDKDPDFHIFTFYETRTTSLPRKLFPQLPAAWSQEEVLVDFRSANPLIVGFPLPLDRPHVLTNKFENPGCPDYQKVAGKVQDFLHIIREASPLQQAEKWIYENHYSEAKLQIERVSGELLSMQQCYINLAMIEQPKVRIDRSDDNSERKEGTQKASPFSLSARLKVETPNEAIQVELNDIFRSREGASGRLIPRHILIRGRAGVGKTTLCKKIIFECTRNDMWKDLFDRVLWIPLRKLKALTEKVYNMESLFFFEYFSHDEDSGRTLAKALTKAVLDSRTLFVLDGLDEISSLLGQETPLSGFLTSLLNQTNIIVTSRPHVSLRSALVPDLELETIGFYLDQVNQYIEETFANRPEISNKIKSFLQDHALVQDLVRIPVQLDALCYTWDEGHEHTADLSTMTRIYRAIEQRLWRKDVLHLTKVHDGRAVTKSEVDSCGPQGIEAILALEISLVEELAFIGLHNDLIEFAPDIQQAAFSRLRRQLLPGKTLPYISFLRTSDLKSEASRSYHFLHLTYQEYFAARYFVRQWLASPSPTLVLNYNDRGGTGFTAIRYLQKHKYTTRYNILWRFVAGLLAAEGRAKDFLDVIEDEPRDLLGPLHQRLVIHCLAEVANSSLSNSPVTNITLWQKVLEDHLIEWLIFEIENTDDCLLLREAQILPSVLVKTLQKLREKEFDTQFKLLDGIAKWQNASALTIEFLSSWLEDGGGPQYSVVVALGTNPVLSNSLVSHIAVRLQDDKSHMRIAALKTLGAQKTISEAILLQMGACLNDDEWTVRQQALKVLGSRAVLPEAILSQIISQLECEDEELRQTAVDALKVHAALAESVLSQIAARLGNDDFRVRQASVEVLGARADAPETILLQVVARLGDPHEDVRETTMNRLLCRKDLSTEISSQITALLRTSDATIQQRAAAILHKTTMMRPEVIRQQIAARLKGLARPETYIIRIAILLEARREFDLAAVIWELVPQSVPQEAVLEVIVAFLADSELRVQSAARLALARKAGLPKTILKQIAAYFGDKSDSVRLGALHLLRSSPRLPHAIVMHVLLFLGDKDDSIREAAGEVLFRQTDLSGCILEPHVRLIYTQALRISWERDICWLRDRTDPSRHYLQIESRLNHLRNWSPRMTAEIADIAAQLRVPRSKKSVKRKTVPLRSRIPVLKALRHPRR